MSEITEHDREQERECDDRVNSRIRLSVISHTIGIDQSLERRRELVRAEESGRALVSNHLKRDMSYSETWRVPMSSNLVEDGCHRRTTLFSTSSEGQLDGLNVCRWDPAFSY